MPLFDNDFADGRIGMAIAPGINEPRDAAFGQSQPGRALDLHEEKIDPIPHPRDFEAAPGIKTIFDFGAGWSCLRAVAGFNVTLERRVHRRWRCLALRNGHELRRARENGNWEIRVRRKGAGDFGLVIAGDEPARSTVRQNLERRKMLFEKGLRVARPAKSGSPNGLKP